MLVIKGKRGDIGVNVKGNLVNFLTPNANKDTSTGD